MKIIVKSLALISVVGLSSCGMSNPISAFTESRSKKGEVAKKQEKVNVRGKAKDKEPEKKEGGLARWSFSDLMPSRVPIVKVRPDQLKEIKSGKEKALAYQSSRRGFFGSFFGKPVDFKEPALPQGAIDNPEFGLLPPKPE